MVVSPGKASVRTWSAIWLLALHSVMSINEKLTLLPPKLDQIPAPRT